MTTFTYVLQATVSASVMALFVMVIRPFARRKLPHSLTAVLWVCVFAAFIWPLFIPNYAPVQFVVSPAMYNITTTIIQHTFVFDTIPYITGEANAAYKTAGYLPEIIWAAGMVLLACFFLIQRIRLGRYFSGAKTFYSAEYNAYLSGVKRRVTIHTSEHVKTPITFGVLKPRIILPLDFPAKGNIQSKHAIIHEIRHIRHFDSLFNVLWLGLVCIHWFNPLVWLCRILIKMDMEFRCDAAVVKSIGYESKAEYARALVELAPVLPVRPVFSMPLASPDIKNRIVNIMRLRKPTISSRITAVVLAVLMLPIGMVSISSVSSISASVLSPHSDILTAYAIAVTDNAESAYAVVWIGETVSNERHAFELIGFTDAPPDDLSFSKHAFGTSFRGVIHSFIYDCADLIIDGEITSDRYMIIDMPSFESKTDMFTANSALQLMNGLDGYWSFSRALTPFRY
ncbi:MAG: M56 family metallopeptidase [Defluviitaleaceae bacterium]|nr:M56 family metallopeptidase [Defluviitaleaceae bacterium]MCL2835963.1 M56 family metallopeptidase [Defluviitaleaceae bacterium]